MPSHITVAASSLLAAAALAAPATKTEPNTTRFLPQETPYSIILPRGSDEDSRHRWIAALARDHPDAKIETFPSEPTKTMMHGITSVPTALHGDREYEEFCLQHPWVCLPVPEPPCDSSFDERCNPQKNDPEFVKCVLHWMKSEHPQEPNPCVDIPLPAQVTPTPVILPRGRGWYPTKTVFQGVTVTLPPNLEDDQELYCKYQPYNPNCLPGEPTHTVASGVKIGPTALPAILAEYCIYNDMDPYCKGGEPSDAEMTSVLSEMGLPMPTTLHTTTKPTKRAEVTSETSTDPEPTETPGWLPFADPCMWSLPIGKCDPSRRHVGLRLGPTEN